MPVYWKPKYGTRSSRHKAWVRQQQKREAANEGRPKVSVRQWLGQLFRR